MAVTQTKAQFRSGYLARNTKSAGRKPGLDTSGIKRRRKRKRYEANYRHDLGKWNKRNASNIAQGKSAFDKAFGNRTTQDYTGQNFEKKYGSEAANTVMGAFEGGQTGMLSQFNEGAGGGITEHRFGDVNEVAGRIQNRRDIKSNLAEGKYAGGTGALNSASGGAGFNILASASQAAKKKKPKPVGYTASSDNQLYNAAAMG